MSEQQNDVSPATTGGPSVPDPIGTIRRVGEKSLVLCGGPNGGRRWVDVASGGHIVDGDFWRVDTRPVVGAVPGSPAAHDPRDAEIERLQGELGAKEQRSFDNYAELLNVINEGERPPVGASHFREVREAIVRALALRAQIKAERDQAHDRLADCYPEIERLRWLVGSENVGLDWVSVDRAGAIRQAKEFHEDRLKWMRMHDERVGEVARLHERLENQRAEVEEANAKTIKAIEDRNTVEAERDRLRAELDWIAEQPVGSNPYWQQRSARVEAERDAIHEALVAVQGVLHATEARLTKKPAEPRRWVAGDPPPEVGTTVQRGSDRYTRYKRGWSRNGDFPFVSWVWMTKYYPGELVEVVSSDD